MSEKEDNKLFDKLCKKVGYTLGKYQLIEPNDNIMVGVSGGKDSLFLLEALANRKKHLPFPVKIMASHIHVKEIGYKISKEYLEELCQHLGVPYYYDEISVDVNADPKKAPCFVCSWHRRKRLFELTKELNCCKLALGHHMDDALETLMMNMIYHGSISSMPASLKMFGGRMNLIRPLIELTNNEMIEMSRIRKYPKLKDECPYGDKTKRGKVRKLIEDMSEINKNARKNMFRSMDNLFAEYLPKDPHK
jgi:tRNA(Ile)-lysidine synthetase-like protein